MNDNIILKINAETSLERSTKISKDLYGLFLEDINYAVDGGLYAEMIKNRSFEYAEFAEDGGWHGWDKVNKIDRMIIDGITDNSCLNRNNTHYARLINNTENYAGIAGSGYLDGMSVKQDAHYNFSVFLRANKGYTGSVLIRIVDGNGGVLAEGSIPSISGEWAKYEMEYHLAGGFGLGTWQTAAKFEDIKVVDNRSNTLLYTVDCTDESMAKGEIIAGEWSAKNDAIYQSNLDFPKNMTNGDAIYFGDNLWENYTLTLKATKLEGTEGFQIAVGVKNKNEFFVWNIGGWGNTMSTMEKADNGVKSGQQAGTTSKIHIETGRTYDIKIEVIDSRIICYLDGNQMIDYTVPCQQPVYQVTSLDENGDMIIKLVNTMNSVKEVSIKLDNFNPSSSAEVTTLASNDLQASNTKENPTCVVPIQTVINAGKDFVYTAPAYSVSIIRLHSEG